MATIREVANHAGVSIGTVSKVLNGLDNRVAQATRDRVWASIRELRYRPPAFEQNQKAALSQNLGVIVPDLTELPLLSNGYLHHILDGILEASALRGWSVTVFADKMWDDVGNAVRRKYDGRCDALVLVAPQPDRDIVKSIHQRGAPVVQIGTTAWLDDVSSIDMDNVEAGRLVARHFMDLGHRRLSFLTTPQEQVSSAERYRGYQEVAGDGVVRLVQDREETVERLAARIAAMGERRPTALMGWHDGIVSPLVAALDAEGLNVPTDLSLAGVDAVDVVGSAGLVMTSVVNPLGTLARRGATMAIDRVLDGGLPREVIRLAPTLRVGATSAPPRGD